MDPEALRKTSEREGNFWSVQQNLDGNRVCYGMAATDPAAFGRIFGASWAKLLDATGRVSVEAVDGVSLWAEPWVSRFASVGRWRAFQQVQARVAAESEHMAGAIEIAGLLRVNTERAMYYNRTVTRARRARSAQPSGWWPGTPKIPAAVRPSPTRWSPSTPEHARRSSAAPQPRSVGTTTTTATSGGRPSRPSGRSWGSGPTRCAG